MWEIISFFIGFVLGVVATSMFASKAYERGYKEGQRIFDDDMK